MFFFWNEIKNLGPPFKTAKKRKNGLFFLPMGGVVKNPFLRAFMGGKFFVFGGGGVAQVVI